MKTKNYLYEFYNSIKSKIKYPFSKVKSYHQIILQTDITKFYEEKSKNPYQALWEWLIDVLVFGCMCFVLYSAFFEWKGWESLLLLLGLGFIPTIIKQIREAIKGE